MNRIINILLKTLSTLLIIIICLTAIAYYALQLPEIQTTITQKSTDWLSEKLGGNITVGQARISWLDEITFEDINIKDLKGRDMIYIRELYVNCKTNFTFDPKKIIRFDNNLDYVLLKNPEVKLTKEKNGRLNIDDWISAINKINYDSTKKKIPNQNKPFTIDNAYIKNGFVTLNDGRKERMPEDQFDYYNFRFDKINANLENVFILGDTVSFKATTVNGIDNRSKLEIKNIKTDFLYCNTAMLLDNLGAFINNSYLGNSLHFYYERPSAFNDFFNKVIMKANLKNSIFHSQDLGRFSNNMYSFKERYILTAKMEGKYVDLDFKNFELKFGSGSNLNGSVNFKGFPNLKKTKTTLTLLPSVLEEKDVKQYSQNNDFQNYISKIEKLDFSGSFVGVYTDFAAKTDLNAKGLGKLKGLINVKIAPESVNSTYLGDLIISNLDLGKLVNEPKSLQKISFEGKIKGNGLKISDATLELDGSISSIGYKGYDYKNITVDGKLGQSIFDGFLKIIDPNLEADVTGKVDFNKELNSFKIKGNLLEANLQQLGLTQQKMNIKSEINFDFIGNKLDDWIGKAQFLNTIIKDSTQSLAIDSLFFNSSIFQKQKRFSVISEFFNIYINGSFVPSQLISDVNSLAKEYTLYFKENAQERATYYNNKKLKISISPYEAKYKVYFKNSSPFFAFFEPKLFISPGSNIGGEFAAKTTTQLSMEGELDTVVYNGNDFYNTTFDFNSSKTAFAQEVLTSLIIQSENQKIANELQTQKLKVNAYWGQYNTIDFDASILQKSTKSYGSVFGKINFLTDGYEIKFNPKNSVLNLIDKKWIFSANNLISVINDELHFTNFKLSNNNQSVSLNGKVSNDSKQESVLTIQDFNLLTLKPFTNVEVKGIANGELRVRDYFKNPFFTSNLYIDELIYKNSLIGTIASEAIWNNVTNKLNINGNVYRINQEIFRVNGYYDPENKANPLSLKAKIRNLNLQMFEGMLEGTFSNLFGLGEGEVSISGTPLDPIFKGEVEIKRGTIKVVSSGTTLYFDDTIVLNEEGFVASSKGIVVRDAPSGGNLAEIQGGVFNGGSGKFMVGIHAYIRGKEGFKIMNTKNSDNQRFYGQAFVNGDLHLTGDFSNLNVTANLTSKKGTKITIPLDGEKSIDIKQEGIPFIGKEIKIDSSKIVLTDKTKKIKTSGVKMAFNLTFTPDAECEIIFDRLNNDVLDVFGNGKLSIFYDTRGDFTINGPYVVSSGKYNFSFQNLASLRKFNIVDGSRINWSGDPYEATLDMKASYIANIPIFKLTQLASDASARYPVNVMVSLKDRLMTPTILYNVNFDLKQIPLASQPFLLGFEQKLKNDEQLLSRNVSSILVFNEVFSDNFTDALTQQFLIDNVSNLLSNQIGNLANKLNPNLELGVQFGDFRENILNNMQLNFSYRFLNNRVKLSGKSSFINAIENSINVGNPSQLSVGGELEYLLSQDGEYRLKLFSRSVPTNFYTFTSTGNVVVSGGNLIISRNFNSFLSNKKNKVFPIGANTFGPAKKEEVDLSLEKKGMIQ